MTISGTFSQAPGKTASRQTFGPIRSPGSIALGLDLTLGKRLVGVTAALVVALGIAREVFVMRFGTGTALQDLRPLGLDQELSIPAFYSSMLMIAAAVIMAIIWRLAVVKGDGTRRGWLVLSVLFGAFAIDESASLHEVLMTPLRSMLGASGMFYYAWVIPGLIGVVLIGLYLVPFLWRLPRRTALSLMVAGAIFVAGALGLEMVGGSIEEQMGKETLNYVAVMVTEESLELLGLTLFLWALSDYAASRWGHLRIVAG